MLLVRRSNPAVPPLRFPANGVPHIRSRRSRLFSSQKLSRNGKPALAAFCRTQRPDVFEEPRQLQQACAEWAAVLLNWYNVNLPTLVIGLKNRSVNMN